MYNPYLPLSQVPEEPPAPQPEGKSSLLKKLKLDEIDRGDALLLLILLFLFLEGEEDDWELIITLGLLLLL